MEILKYDNNKHREQVIELWKSVFGYTDARNNPATVIDKKIDIDDQLFVAVQAGKVIGSVMAGYDGHRGWIYSLAVLPENRKSGTGSALLAHAEKSLAATGCPKINLQILASNSGVRDFYEKNGYAVEERISMGKRIKENIPGS